MACCRLAFRNESPDNLFHVSCISALDAALFEFDVVLETLSISHYIIICQERKEIKDIRTRIEQYCRQNPSNADAVLLALLHISDQFINLLNV